MGPRIAVQVDKSDPAKAAQDIRRLGVELLTVHFHWGDAEQSPGEFDWHKGAWIEPLRAELDGDLPPLVWLLFPIHMNARGPMPADVAADPLDSPRLIERFDAFVAAAAQEFGWSERDLIVVGNEVDFFVDGNPTERESVVRFLNAAADSVHRHAPGARAAHAMTYDGLSKEGGRALFDALNVNTDFVSFTWYGLTDGVQVDPAGDLETVLARMADAAAGKPLLLQEISLPSSAGTGGSEELQARRVHNLFDAVEKRTGDELLGAIWLDVDDWGREFMRGYIGGQFPEFEGNDAFLDFLTSLGLRAEGGREKPAFAAWLERHAARPATR
jgi:hypothetical protein